MCCRAFSTSPRAAPTANACTAGVGRLFPVPATGKIKLQLFSIFRKKVLAIFLKVRYNIQAVRETATSNAPLAQLDRVFDYESKGRGFESRGARQLSPHVLIQSMRTSFCIYRRINRQNAGYNYQVRAIDARIGLFGVILPDGGFHFPALFSLIIPIFRGRNQRFIMKCTLRWTIAGYRPTYPRKRPQYRKNP